MRAPATARGPQGTFLFRLLGMLGRLQLGYLLRNAARPQLVAAVFLVVAGATALGIITAAAWLTHLPFLFPPLGPSAFILFRTPLSVSASPRSVILSHALGLGAGLAALHGVAWVSGHAGILDPGVLDGARIVAIALAMALVSVGMVTLHCDHPPAAATALIGAMGLLQTPLQGVGLMAAVLLLVAEAMLFVRLLGGLPYPRWTADPEVVRVHGTLAGMPGTQDSFWGQITRQLYRRRA